MMPSSSQTRLAKVLRLRGRRAHGRAMPVVTRPAGQTAVLGPPGTYSQDSLGQCVDISNHVLDASGNQIGVGDVAYPNAAICTPGAGSGAAQPFTSDGFGNVAQTSGGALVPGTVTDIQGRHVDDSCWNTRACSGTGDAGSGGAGGPAVVAQANGSGFDWAAADRLAGQGLGDLQQIISSGNQVQIAQINANARAASDALAQQISAATLAGNTAQANALRAQQSQMLQLTTMTNAQQGTQTLYVVAAAVALLAILATVAYVTVGGRGSGGRRGARSNPARYVRSIRHGRRSTKHGRKHRGWFGMAA